MKWKKLGKIFDPNDYSLGNNYVGFSQSPQALVFDDYVRIYFSTREKDRTGKFLSHVAFVEMDRGLRNILRVSRNPVIELGSLGTFDEHGIFPMNVVRVDKVIYGYTTGWNRRVSVSVDASIGLAMSYDNGKTFKKVGKGPIMSTSLNEPFLVGDAFVAVMQEKFHMWYIAGQRWVFDGEGQEPDRVYKIMHATSSDGIEWEKEGRCIIPNSICENECQALPTVIAFDNLFHMFFCYRQATDFRKNRNRAYRIGYAYSNNLTDWVRDDSKVGIDVSETGWDSDMLCYPNVFKIDSDIYMLYNGNDFGRYGFGLAQLVMG